MDAVKPWQLFVMAFLCLLPTLLVVGAGLRIAYVRRDRPDLAAPAVPPAEHPELGPTSQQ